MISSGNACFNCLDRFCCRYGFHSFLVAVMATAALLMSAFGTGDCRFATVEFDSDFNPSGREGFPEVTSADFGLWEYSNQERTCVGYSQDQMNAINNDKAWKAARVLKIFADCFGVLAFAYVWFVCIFPIKHIEKSWTWFLTTCFFFAWMFNVAAFCFFDNNICSAKGSTCKISQSSRLAIAGSIFYFVSMFLACKVPSFREIETDQEGEGESTERDIAKPSGAALTGMQDMDVQDQGTVATDAPASPTIQTIPIQTA